MHTAHGKRRSKLTFSAVKFNTDILLSTLEVNPYTEILLLFYELTFLLSFLLTFRMCSGGF